MNTTELIINRAMEICEAHFMEYPDYDPEVGLTLQDALTVIVMDSMSVDDDVDSSEVYDLIEGLTPNK